MEMKRFHIAIAVADVVDSIRDYSRRLGCRPEVVIDGEYALWRTKILNLSIRKIADKSGTVRHIGWEDASVKSFSQEEDVNGLIWEKFSVKDQLEEIKSFWPDAELEGVT
jgi:tRNA (guanine-N7-)-methyltransferase